MPQVPGRIAAFFTSLNTHKIGLAGIATGGTAIIAALAALVKLLSDPKYLASLYYALLDARHHAATSTDVFVLAQLIAACMALVGALAIGFAAAYFGRPTTIPGSPPK
jgi:hypothetical protein